MAWKDLNKEPEEDQVSKINAAGLINITLENLFRDCYIAMANYNYKLWMIKLDSIWTILGGDEKRDSDADKYINTLDLKIYKLGDMSIPVNRTFNKKPESKSKDQYQLLKLKTIYLRRLQNKQGKATSYLNNDDYDFD